MHIGIEATAWDLRRGFGRHLRCLVTALLALESGHRFSLFSDCPSLPADLPGETRVVATGNGDPKAAGQPRTPRELWRLSRTLADPSLDILLFPSVHSFVPVWSRAQKIVILHDVTADLYPAMTFGSWRDRWLWNLKVALARWQAHRLVTVSEHSRQGLVQRFGCAQIEVLGEASDPIFRPLEEAELSPGLRARGVSVDRRLLVYVGGFAPFKNVAGLLASFARLAFQPHLLDVDLILVGEDRGDVFHSSVDELRSQVASLGLDRRVHFTGFVSDPELVGLLNLATLLVLPSFNEGFGLPAVEAAACGCPVVATQSSPLPQLLGRGGLFVDPHAPEQLQQALEQVLSDSELRSRMASAALAAARRLSWEDPARRLLTLLEKSVA